MVRRRNVLCVVLPVLSVLALGWASSASATTFYVDPLNGSMEGDGSAQNPWETLQGVFDNNLIETKDKDGYVKNPGAPVKAGDTLLLLSGYHGDIYESVYFNDADITIEAADGHTPQLKRLRMSGGKNWIIRGLTISPSFASPFERVTIVEFYSRYSAHGTCSDMTVEDCTIYTVADSSGWSDTDWDTKACNGIILGMDGGTGLVARNNTLRNVNFGISAQAGGCLAEHNTIENFSGDGIRATFHDVVIQYNVIRNCYDVNANHDDGIQSFLVNVGPGAVYRIKLIGNIIINSEDPSQPYQGTLQGIGIFDGPYYDFVVENNLVLTNQWHGITLHNSQNARIVNNTVFSKWWYDSESDMTTWIEVTSGETSGGNLVRNSIAHSIRTSGDSSATADHNLTVSRTDDASQWFVDYGTFDMHLVLGSPAIDAGSSVSAPDTDIEGNPRPSGDDWDVGAYEYIGDGNQPPVADAGLDQTVTDADDNGSEDVTLDGSGSHDPDGTIESYVWTENAQQIATGANPTVTFDVGVHTVTLEVTDDGGATDTDEVVITVNAPNQPPVADAGPDQTLTDNSGKGVWLKLDGSGSYDPDGEIVSYVWTEGGQQIATGEKPRVKLQVGVHTITLEVTDDGGATDTDEVVITVNPKGGSSRRRPK